MQRRYIGLVAMVLVLAIMVSGCKSAVGEAAVDPIAVEVAKVTLGTVQSKSILSGKIQGRSEVPVVAKLPLKILSVEVEVGDEVQAGQVLVRLDPKDVAQQVRQAEAALAMAEAVLPPAVGESAAAEGARLANESAQADLARMEELHKQGAVSDQMLEQVRAKAAAAAAQYRGILDKEKAAWAQYDQAAAAVALARSQLEETTITAPISGVVSSLPVEAGQMVGSGTVVAMVVDMDEVKINVNISERDIPYVKNGQEVTAKIKSLNDQVVKGKLTALAPAADPRTQTFKAEIKIDNKDRVIKPGMFAEVSLNSVAAENVVVVPSRAILQKGAHYVAYIIDENNIASVREVTLG
ncbi:MAG: efflux RND transporter periplasmic adaptor subunit, partial [Firmicutes bacterium]|nr:efflux RND transporter periplasmic adaptor subunit [Bacillota bacterium]